MSEYKKGVENIPLRSINTKRLILVMLINLRNNDEIVAEYILDYANIDDRKHLGRLTFWAVSNHHSVETMAIEDASPPFVKD